MGHVAGSRVDRDRCRCLAVDLSVEARCLDAWRGHRDGQRDCLSDEAGSRDLAFDQRQPSTGSTGTSYGRTGLKAPALSSRDNEEFA